MPGVKILQTDPSLQGSLPQEDPGDGEICVDINAKERTFN
jgi:hypothetical protein